MKEVDDSEISWLHELDDELSKRLLDDSLPLIFSPEIAQSETIDPHESLMNKLVSTVYSGPTISDIENALALTHRSSSEAEGRSRMQPAVPAPEKGHGKIDNRYTVKVKRSGNEPADDGYKWRKYGQKFIKNSPNPRSYYRCTNPRCTAKKQVEKSMEDPETLIVSYEGLHLHYTYSHFLRPQPRNSLPNAGLHTPKRPKIQSISPEDQDNENKTQSPPGRKQELQQKRAENLQEEHPEDPVTTDLGIREKTIQHGLLLEEEPSSQGLLEDIVPWLIRKPCNSTTSSTEPSSSRPSSPSYSSSLSCSPANFYFDVGRLSSII